MATLLKHSKSGRVYPYNEYLARRDDMVQVTTDGTLVSDDPQVVKPRKRSTKIQSPDEIVASLNDDFS